MCAGDSDSKLKAAFLAFDTNADGYIDATEMAKILRTLCHVRLSDDEMNKAPGSVSIPS